MPIITVKIAKGRDLKTKREFVKAIKDTSVKVLNIKNLKNYITGLMFDLAFTA